MLRWILGVSLKLRKRNADFRQAVEVACISQTSYGKQDCDGMGTCSEEKMIAVSKRSWKLKYMVVGVADIKRRDGLIGCCKTW